MKYLVPFALVVVVALSIWFFVKKSPNNAQVNREASQTLAADKLPAGFPLNIPVEVNNITEGIRTAYASKGVVQYNVSYTSVKDRDDLWDVYANFLKDDGYSVNRETTSKSLGSISGAKGENTLSVNVSSRSDLSLVQISYLER